MARVFRRKRRQPADPGLHDRFMSCLVLVEEAKERLLAAVPSARRRGVTPAEGVMGFELSLREAQGAMSGWLDGTIGAEWDACDAALREALHRAERLRTEAPVLEFEPLLAAVGELIEPLDAFEDAAERLRKASR
jgi:hypothetical protein